MPSRHVTGAAPGTVDAVRRTPGRARLPAVPGGFAGARPPGVPPLYGSRQPRPRGLGVECHPAGAGALGEPRQEVVGDEPGDLFLRYGRQVGGGRGRRPR
ncbi:hypothetical protein GCM10018773_47570 [Streptomyces candidus]|nr:hypothetical protein GCM10018773_47570 [Streptomyces candidus]